MRLLVTSARRLRRRYGARSERVLSTLQEYVELIETTGQGAAVVRIDEPSSVEAWGVLPVEVDGWEAALRATRAIARAATRDTRSEASLTLIGGPSIIPFCRLANPIADRTLDPDPWVPTDVPYASDDDTLEAYIRSDRTVGRIPDPGTRKADDFVRTLRRQMALHSEPRRSDGAVAIYNREWQAAAAQVATAMPAIVEGHACPDYRIGPDNRHDLDRAYLYFNLHGFADRGPWMAYRESRASFVPVLHPDAFDGNHMAGSVIFAENCYGSHIEGKTHHTSCALRALSEGARSFVGPTGLAFASHIPPPELSFSHDLAARFLRAHVDGRPAGLALRTARQEYFGRAAREGGLSPFEAKTALQFACFGDPML